jgi:hypothetical protein
MILSGARSSPFKWRCNSLAYNVAYGYVEIIDSFGGIGILELLRRLSIKKQLSILVICTLLVIFFLFFLEYIKISSITIKNNNEYTSDIFSQIKQ